MIAQEAKVSLEEALEIIGGGKHKLLKDKLLHSVELIRKAEKLALLYDPENGFFNTFSGGKDSQAMYHVAKMAGVKFQTHMNLTSVDPPQVIRFVRKQYPGVITHAPEKSIFQLTVDRGILPSMRIRWCCADLKETAGAGKVTLIGIRKEESTRRANRHEVEVSSKAFSGNLEEFGEWQKEQIEKKEAKLLRKMKREGKKVNEDEFSLTKDNEVRCINGKDSILISPIFEWTERDVWYFLNEVVKVPHCELYDQGYKRIGCILCPMSQYKQKVREMRDFPHVKRNWIKAIKAIRAQVDDRTSEQTGENSNTGVTPSPNGKRKSCSNETGRWQRTAGRRSNNSSKSSNYPPRQTPAGMQPSEDWIRKTRTFNGKMAYFRSGNVKYFEAIGTGKPTAGFGGVLLRGHWNRKTNSGIWRGFRTAPLLVAQ